MQMYFCKGYDHGEKVDLSEGYWNPKRKMWVTTHFSEKIELS